MIKSKLFLPAIIVAVALVTSAGILFEENFNFRLPSLSRLLGKQVEYVSPYGYSFDYPENLRFARKTVNFLYSLGQKEIIDAKDVVLILTTATEEDEDRYIEKIKELAKANPEIKDVTNPNASYLPQSADFPEFYPEKSVLISPGPPLAYVKEFANRKIRAPAQGFDTIDATEINSIKEIKSVDGTKGLSYVVKPMIKIYLGDNVFEQNKPAKLTALFPLKGEGFTQQTPTGERNISQAIQLIVSVDAPGDIRAIFESIIETVEIL